VGDKVRLGVNPTRRKGKLMKCGNETRASLTENVNQGGKKNQKKREARRVHCLESGNGIERGPGEARGPTLDITWKVTESAERRLKRGNAETRMWDESLGERAPREGGEVSF